MTEATWTRGEVFAGRALEKEKRAGVPHYVTGQHHAELTSRLTGSLSYVDVMGHVVILAIVNVAVLGAGKEWRAAGYALRVGMLTGAHKAELPPEFKLSEKMLAAIAAAEERYPA